MIGVVYHDEYAVAETFQLLKVPWEWYDRTKEYDVVIGCKNDFVSCDVNNFFDITKNDVFKKVSILLNQGVDHNKCGVPLCEQYLDSFRKLLVQSTTLIEIPPIPYKYKYMVALTHDVDITSVKERSWCSVGYGAYQSFRKVQFKKGMRILLAKLCVLKTDPWNCFDEWMALENSLHVNSTFYFMPFDNQAGSGAPKIRAGKYKLDKKRISKMQQNDYEIGVHGIDNWIDAKKGKEEYKRIEELTKTKVGTRIHWLFFDVETWSQLDKAGYYYDTSFGYNENVGFRAGTLQVYRPRGVKNIFELPLHIQDGALFRKRYLGLNEEAAKEKCDAIFTYAKRYGGVVTLLWHQVSMASPYEWSSFYKNMVRQCIEEEAWVARAVDIVKWFEMRRRVSLYYTKEGNKINIHLKGLKIQKGVPKMRVRIYINSNTIKKVNTNYIIGDGYVDVLSDTEHVEVVLQ